MKFQVTPHALPGCCFFCRSSNREGYVDSEFSQGFDDPVPTDLMGAVYICVDCIKAFARTAGIGIVEDKSKSDRKVEELEAENYQLRKDLTDYDSIKRAVDSLNQRHSSPTSLDSSSALPNEESREVSDEPVGVSG